MAATPPQSSSLHPLAQGWRAFVRARRQVLGWLALVIGLVCALVGWELRTSYLDTRERAQLAAQNLSLLLKEQLDGAFRETDLVLRDLSGKVDAQRLAQLATLPSAQLADLSQLLADKQATLPHVETLALLGPDGRLALSAERLIETHSEQEGFYLRLYDNPGQEVAFSPPFALPGSSELAFVMARRLPGRDGQLAGMVMAVVKLEYFDQLARRLDAPEDSSFTLFDSDMVLVGRYPPAPGGMIGRPAINAAQLERWVSGRSRGYSVVESPIDRHLRGYSFHRLDNFPFVVMVGLSEQRSFSDWRLKAGAYVLTAILLMLFALVMIWRGWREAELALAFQAGQQRLQEHDAHIVRALETLSRPILLVRAADHSIVLANDSAAALCGYSRAELAGLPLPQLFLRPEHQTALSQQLDEKLSLADYELKLLRPGGESFWAALSGSVIDYAGEPAYFLTLGDISERKQAQEHLWQRATRDPLTGIANRGYFMERAQHEWQRARRYQHPLALLVLDLDHFKAVNDRYGHDAGDLVLQVITQRIQRELRDSDLFGRLGGEEFCVLLPEEHDGGMLDGAERLRRCAAELPVVLPDGRQLVVTLSIGCACSRPGLNDFGQLLKQADQALYAAKHAGRNCVVSFASLGDPAGSAPPPAA